jgi:hypothetical protein
MMRKLVLMAILAATVDPAVAQVACPNPVPDEPTRPQIVACLGEIQKLLGEIQQLKAAPHQLEIIAGTGNADGRIEQRVIGENAHRITQEPTNHGLYTLKVEPPFKNRPVVLVLPNAGGLTSVVDLTTEKGLFNGFKFSNKPLTKDDESRIVTLYQPFTFLIVADEGPK